MGTGRTRKPKALARRVPSDAQNRRQLKAAVSASAVTLGEILGAFCRRAGMSRREVSAVFQTLAAAALRRELRLEPQAPPLWSHVSDAISRWWHDPQYLDEHGRPRALPEHGPAPSIDALLGPAVGSDRLDDAKTLLTRTAVVIKRGRWHFDDEHGRMLLFGEQAIERLGIAMSGMFTNSLDNLIRRRAPTASKNFDRTALVASFPMAMVPELRSKLRQRLQLAVESADEWLTDAAARPTRGPVALVGVTTFVHTATPRPRPDTPKRTSRASPRRAKTKGRS